MIDPSKEAIEAAFDEYTADRNLVKSYVDNVKSILKTAYAIDFAQLQVERDQLRTDLRHATARTEQLAIEAGEAIGQAKRLREALQESQQEVGRLRGDLNGATRDVIYLTKERDRLQEEVERLQYDNNEAATAIEGFGERLAVSLANSNLLARQVEQQKTIIQELAEALRAVRKWARWARGSTELKERVDGALAKASP